MTEFPDYESAVIQESLAAIFERIAVAIDGEAPADAVSALGWVLTTIFVQAPSEGRERMLDRFLAQIREMVLDR